MSEQNEMTPDNSEAVETISEKPLESATTSPISSDENNPIDNNPTVEEDAKLFEAAVASLGSSESTTFDPAKRKLSKGDKVEATVIQVEKERVFVDLGTKTEGIIPLLELTDQHVDSAIGLVQIGDKLQVIVLKAEGGAESNPIVSKKRVDFEHIWNNILDNHTHGTIVTAQVIDRIKGGLVVDIGVRGFVPATHVGNGKLRNIDRFVGKPLAFKIIEVDKERKKVVLSNRLAEEETQGEAKDKLFTTLKVGDVIEGIVRRLTDYGVFIDLGGIDGLLHISEMSWSRIDHPKEVLKEGQKTTVMVLKLDPSLSKISLGLRQVLPDPWKIIKEKYQLGHKFMSPVTRLVHTGAFIKLPEGAEAFLPIGEMSDKKIKTPEEAIKVGEEEYEMTVVDFRPDERRMVVSLRGANSRYDNRFDGDRRRRPSNNNMRRGRPDDGRPEIKRVPTSGATIGERWGALKDLFENKDK